MIFCDSTGASVECCSHCSQTDGKAWVISSLGGVWSVCVTFTDCAVIDDMVALRIRCTCLIGMRKSREVFKWAHGGSGLYCSFNVYKILQKFSFP